MPAYRYYSSDLLTGEVIAELPLYGVFLQRLLSNAGQMTATYKLDTGIHRDVDLLQGSEPSKTALFVERDETLIWGGIIWSRTYSSQSKTVQLSGQTFESWFSKTVIENDFIKQNVEQALCFRDLVVALQAQTGSNFHFDTSQMLVSPSPTLTTILIPHYEYHFASEVVDMLVGVDGGLDYTIALEDSGVIDQPDKVFRVAWPKMGNTDPSATIVFDYPGTVDNYYWPESGATGATRQVGLGGGNGNQILRAQVDHTDLIGAGYPSWWRVDSYRSIQDIGLLTNMTQADATRYKMPYSSPTFSIKPDTAVGFEDWDSLGNTIQIHVEDARFPGGKDINSRMIGWDLSTGDSDTSEELKILIEGESGE